MLTEIKITNNYVSANWPEADYTAPWHVKNATIANWIVPHNTKIIYSFNQYGYRDNNWDDHEMSGIWCLGDSQTVGMGVDQKQIWPTLLGNNTLNLGVAGASNDTMSRILCSAMQHKKPKAVCVLLTAPNRREIINQIGKATIFPHSLNFLKGIKPALFEEFLITTDPVSDSVNREKNILLIQLCCKAASVPCIIADFDTAMQDVVAQDRAADGLHIGPSTHKAISRFFNEKLLDICKDK